MSQIDDFLGGKPSAGSQSSPSQKPASEIENFLGAREQDNALVRGWKSMTNSAGITKDLATGDAAAVARRVKEFDDYNRANPGSQQGQELSKAWEQGDGISGGIKGVAGEIAKDWKEAPNWVGGVRSLAGNAKAMGEGLVAQVPNMLLPMAGMVGGGVAGGAAAGPVGAAAGAWMGASAGNTMVEGGGMLMDRLNKAGINPQDTAAVEKFTREQGDAALGDAAIKGGIIGAVDAATAGIAGKVLNAPARAAADRALAQLGVDAADKGAVKAATQSQAFKDLVASDAAFKAASTGAGNVARNVGAAALDPAGEFTGEFVGQGVATGDWDTKNAALEAISSMGQSALMYGGQKAYQYATSPLRGSKVDANGESSETPAADDKPAGPLLLGNQKPDHLIAFPDGSVGRVGELESYLSGLPEDQRDEARAKIMGKGIREINDPQAPESRRWWEAYRDGEQVERPDYLAEVQSAVQSGTPYTNQQAVDMVRNTMEDAWLEANVRNEPAAALQEASMAGQQLGQEIAGAVEDETGAIAAVDAQVRTSRILSGLQNAMDSGSMGTAQSLNYVNEALTRIGEQPLAQDEVSRARRLLDARAAFTGQTTPAPLPGDLAAQNPLVDRFADNAGMEALVRRSPSERMGVDPSKGSISKAAAMAVDAAAPAEAAATQPLAMQNPLLAPIASAAPNAAPAASPFNITGDLSAPQAYQAQQSSPQPAQAGRTQAAQPAAQPGLSNGGSTTANTGTQAAAQNPAQSQAQTADSATQAGAEATGINGVSASNAGQSEFDAARIAINSEAKQPEAGNSDPMTIGSTPKTGDAVSVRDGVVYLGSYEALDYDSGDPITVPAGATRGQVAQALRDGGVLTDRQKVFGLKDREHESMDGAATAPTPAAVAPAAPVQPAAQTDLPALAQPEQPASAAPAAPKAATADPKQQKAIDRIHSEKGAFFFSKPKAEAFLADNGLQDGYEIVQKEKAFVIQAKHTQAATENVANAGAVDYEAQVQEMLDPSNPRASVTIAAGHEIPDSIFRAQTNRRDNPGYTMKPGANGTVVLSSTTKQAGAASIAGRDLGDGWAEFTPESGTKAVPRAEMPQIKAEHRGAMVNFMNARGVAHEEVTVPANSLKPTQREFSREKVEKAKAFTGGNRAILTSSDGHVLDGHHQWMAARENGEDVRTIRLNAPIDELVKLAHDFPSSTVADGAQAAAGAKSDDTAAPAPSGSAANVDFIKALEQHRKDLPSGFEFAPGRDSLSLKENGKFAVNGLSRDRAGVEEALRLAKQRDAQNKAASASTAPEHAQVGVDERELNEIVAEFNAAQDSMQEDGEQIHHLFDDPAKGEVVRLADKVKVYVNDKGWMTPAEAKAEIVKWKEHTLAQGKTRANADKVVLSLFDYTGKWSQPWEEAGYQVYRFDIQSDPDMGDVHNFSTEFFADWFGDFDGQDIYAILAACPCTDFASSGARHFAAKDTDGRTVASVRLVHQTLATIEHFKPSVWAIENPVGRIEKLGGLPPWRLSFDPNHIGDTYTKKTLLWGRFNGDMPIAPVEPTEGSKMHSQYGGKSLATKNARSATPEGFAYGFFMANNAMDNPVMALANKFDRLDRKLIAKALGAGMTADEIGSTVEDHYYMDLDDAAAEAALRDAIAERGAADGVSDVTPKEPVSNAAQLSLLDAAKASGKLEMAHVGDKPKKAAPHSAAKAEPTAEPDRFADNKLFTADKVAAARERMKKKLGRLNSGIDPELLVDGMTIAGAYIESGVRNFTQYAKAMIEDMGDGVKPYLLSFWEGARNYPGLDNARMTDAAESARQHQALLTPEAREQVTEELGEAVQKPAKRTKKTGSKGDMTLTQDWGVEHIDGYGNSTRETGNDTKDAFLKEAKQYLNAVADELASAGFEAHTDRKGKPGKAVSANESGMAGSGDVSLTVQHPESGTNVYVHIGDTVLRGMFPSTPSGIAVMARLSQVKGDTYANKGQNRWLPVDLSVSDLAALLLKEAGATMGTQTRATETKEENNGNPEQTGRAADQGRTPEVSGRGGRDNDSAAPADSGDLEGRQPSDVPASEDTGRSGSNGVRVPAADVGRAGTADQGWGSGDGRAGTGGASAPDAGAGKQPSVKAPEEVSPANPGPGNFHLDNPLEIVGGTPVARFDKNMAAIELLNQLRESERQATAEEQRTLAGYTGWGSFGQELFQGTWAKPMPKQGWEKRDEWLRDHLGQDEWESAQRSITNAHYTDPPTVMAMWDMVKRMGFGGGRVLEPSMGIGNFFGMMPADIKTRSQLAGIELDSLTGAMATRLYPDANIKVMGYQESKTPDNFYDVVIGNWPFENTVIADRRYNTLSPFLHDYFFLKALDQVRPGGLVVGITSNGTMDKKATRIRAALARKAELVTSIRLPSGAFQEYAGTKVVTDIVILKKRDKALSLTPNDPWINSVAVKTPAGPEVFINEFYAQNPGNVIGTTDYGHGTTRMQPGMIVHRPENMAERLSQAVNLVPEGVFSKEDRTEHISYVTNHTADREGSLSEQNGQLYMVRGEHLAPAQEVRKYALKSEAATAQREQELRALIDMRRKYAALIEAERDGNAEEARKALRKAFEGFNKAHGDLSDSFGLDYLRKIDDPFYPALAALMVNGKPSDILTKSTMRGARAMENPTAQDAYVLARNRSVQPSIAEIAAIAGKPEAEVRAELVKSGAVFEAPNGDVVPSDIYLSGNVRQKLREAQAALDDGNKAMERNVAELKQVIPEDVPYFNIESQLGATWVPAKAYAEYVAHMLNRQSADGIEAMFLNGRWKIRLPDGTNHSTEAQTGFGTKAYPFSKLVNAAFTNQTVKIKRKDGDGNEYVDIEASDEANARIGDIRTKFGEWLWSDPERRSALESEYNESRNSYATPKFDGSFLHMDGMALSLGRGPFNLRQHQVNAIWRALVNRRSLNAHEVGTGKTFTMGGIAVESRRYGIAKKPVLLAHNANSASVAAEIQMMYPAAKVLYIDNLDKDSIAVRMRQIANDDWDTIVMPHSLIDRLSFRETTLMAMAQEDIRALEEEAYAAAEEDGVTLTAKIMDDEDELKKVRSVTAKELVKARNRIIETIKKQSMQSSREGAIPFEDLGIDMVLVDEAHEFKKPPISTRMNMKGLNTQTSNRSIALQFITRYIRANNFGGNVHTFTGTPITNTLTEIFHQMRYVMEDEMKAAGVESWDGWFGSFAKEVQDVELSAAGEYEAINRLAGFINVPELRRMIGQYMDVVFADDMPEMQPRKVNGKVLTSADLSETERAELLNGRTENAADRPYKKVINVTSDLTAEQSEIFSELQGYARKWRQMTGKARKEAMFAGAPESPIITEGLANKASFDVRLMNDEAIAGQEGSVPDSPGSKASKVVSNVLEIYKSDKRAAQVIFAEQGFSTSKDKSMGRDPSGKKITRRAKTFSTMRDIVERLVQGGIPREQIAMVDGSTSKEKRKQIADAMNTLDVRVVIGSTDTLGVGVNMQRNLRAMHHMDAPYMPGELEQRNGRGLRQGNQWNTVLEYRYMTDRLDGRRWQILAIKQRFITAFMKANSDNRVIEGDAASDEESDIVQSFSEAAGDPRILIRAKLRKNVEALQRAERMHGNGVADARRSMRGAEKAIEWNRGVVRSMKAGNLPERLRSMMQAQSEAFSATVQGTQFDVRKEAEEAIDKFLRSEMRMAQSGVKVATYRDQTITARWPSLSSKPELVMEVDGQEFSSAGLRGLEQQIRNYPQRIEKIEANIAEKEASIERLEQVSRAPFARAADLENAQKRLEALEKDIEVNPVPPPAWLRAGAPVYSEAFRAGKPFVVTGHRWTNDGWFVLGQDAKGEMAIPYAEVMDAQGMPLYEEREFQAPEVIEKVTEVQEGTDAAHFGAKTTPSPLDTFPAEFMAELSAVDELFANPRVHAGSAEAALRQVDPTIKFVGDVTAMDERQESGADTKLLFRTAKGRDFFVFEKGAELWLDVSRLGEGDGGSRIYSALMDYAASNDKVFIGDPAGLSDIAMRRRLEAMISSAIKHGSTDHMEPHARQVEGDEKLGIPALKWRSGDTIGNIQRMIDVSLSSIAAHVPEFQRARYDFATGTFRTGAGKPLSDGMLRVWTQHSRMRAAGVGRRSIKRGILLNTLARSESGARPGLLEQALRQQRQLVGEQAKGIFYKGAERSQQQAGSRTDRAVMDMVREGGSAADILGLIASTSKTPFNRKVAQLLGKTGAAPTVTMGGNMGAGGGFTFLAKYSRKNNELSLGEGAAGQAEQIFLHEMIHAATLKSLDRNGVASLQMRKLYEHVKKQDGAAGTYGMKNVGEFVAEAFTNPDFQRALRLMNAPAGNSLKSAWDALVRILKTVLGLPAKSDDALSRALELGVQVMREDKALRQRGASAASNAAARMGVDPTETPAFKRWFGDSRVVGANGKPLVVYHGTPSKFTRFEDAFSGEGDGNTDWGSGFYFASVRNVAEGYSQGTGNVMEVYLSIENPAPRNVVEKVMEQPGAEMDEEYVRDTLSSMGYDGIVIEHNTGKEYVAFRPEQIKSAIANNGNFDPEDADIAHFGVSDAAEAAKNIGQGLKSITATDVKKAGSHKMTDWLKLGLQFMGRRQLVDIYGKAIPMAEYDRLVAQMEADKNDVGAEADTLATRWGKLKDDVQLSELMHDATLAEIDADSSKEYVEGDNKPQSAALKRRFDALSTEAKAVYREARDHYREHHKQVRSAIKERIMRSELSSKKRQELLEKMDADFFGYVKGVYFPLARFGQYVVATKDADGKVISVSRAETMTEAERMREEMRKAFPAAKGFNVGRVTLSKDFIASHDMVGRGFMSELFTALDKHDIPAEQRAELEDTLGQLYLTSLPDLSWAKHGIHRKGTPGFSQDARRAFAQNSFHGARYLAKLRYSDLMADELDNMQKHVDTMGTFEDFDQPKAQRVVDEMQKRHDTLMNPKTNSLSTALTSFGFIFHLGLSPAAAMVNLSQTALVAYPVMGAKWGFKKSAAALLRASNESVKGKNDIRTQLKDKDELAAYDEAVRSGVIDVTMAHDLAGIAQGEDAGMMWKLRPVMRAASFLFHHAERFNRQATFIAAYRLAREAGTEHHKAYEEAVKATYDGHFDYSSANRPRLMQGNVARVVLLFKQFAQNMIYTLGRNAYMAAKGDKEALKTFAGVVTMHAAGAGVLGLPLVGPLLALASALGGDDDDPWDAEIALRNMLADVFGKQASEVIAKGFSRLTPWDISGRVGLNNLIFPDIREGLEGKMWAQEMATGLLGPVVGIGINAARGAQSLAEGDYMRGLENMMPVVPRNAIKSARFLQEGAKDASGIVVKDDVSALGIAGQMVGFSPSEVRLAFEGRTAVMNADRRLNVRRSELLGKFAHAVMNKDSEIQAEAREEIKVFNEKNPGRMIKGSQMWASVHARQRRIDQAEDGVYLPRNRRDAMDAGDFAF